MGLCKTGRNPGDCGSCALYHQSGKYRKPETFELAVQFLEKEIRRTAAMRSHILVLHPGSALDAGAEAGIAQTVRGLNMVLDENEDEVFIALETMAGRAVRLEEPLKN